MPTIAYLANQFPSLVEPYVGHEIDELRRRQLQILACSVRTSALIGPESRVICMQPVRLLLALNALFFLLKRWKKVSRFVSRALCEGNETLSRRLKALLHTWLGAYYALLLKRRNVEHIHVHHGYFGSWVGMVAASLLDAGFSMTLHGSDLLIHDAYLDTKLAESKFCFTISEHNRRHILARFPATRLMDIMVTRLGVDKSPTRTSPTMRDQNQASPERFSLLTVGRLHRVKNHSFLVRACAELRDYGLNYRCEIAGGGPEQQPLEKLIKESGLESRVKLLGHLTRDQLSLRYELTELFVLTSLSEGIPVVLMEAMAAGKIVLAPAITGIPELIVPGVTGFLYEPGNVRDFTSRVLFLHDFIRSGRDRLSSRAGWIRHAAQVQVRQNFSRQQNLRRFGDLFVKLVSFKRSAIREDPLLQQI